MSTQIHSKHTHMCMLTNKYNMHTCMHNTQTIGIHESTYMHVVCIRVLAGNNIQTPASPVFNEPCVLGDWSQNFIFVICGSEELSRMHSFLSREGITHGKASGVSPNGHPFLLRALPAILMHQAS